MNYFGIFLLIIQYIGKEKIVKLFLLLAFKLTHIARMTVCRLNPRVIEV